MSKRDDRFYAGCSNDLWKRVREHNQGRVRSTAYRAPLRPIYYEACLDRDDALRHERFPKTGKGKRFLKKRLAGFLLRSRHNKLERH